MQTRPSFPPLARGGRGVALPRSSTHHAARRGRESFSVKDEDDRHVEDRKRLPTPWRASSFRPTTLMDSASRPHLPPLPKGGRGLTTILATGFGVGFVPRAPGTFGSLWGLLFVWGLIHLSMIGQLGVSLLVILAGVPICGVAAKSLGVKDPGAVVWDEIAAFPIVFFAALGGWLPFDGKTAATGFLFFRLFDITKPWPARRLEHLPGGWGIMADDLIAGAYASAALVAIAWPFGWIITG